MKIKEYKRILKQHQMLNELNSLIEIRREGYRKVMFKGTRNQFTQNYSVHIEEAIYQKALKQLYKAMQRGLNYLMYNSKPKGRMWIVNNNTPTLNDYLDNNHKLIYNLYGLNNNKNIWKQ